MLSQSRPQVKQESTDFFSFIDRWGVVRAPCKPGASPRTANNPSPSPGPREAEPQSLTYYKQMLAAFTSQLVILSRNARLLITFTSFNYPHIKTQNWIFWLPTKSPTHVISRGQLKGRNLPHRVWIKEQRGKRTMCVHPVNAYGPGPCLKMLLSAAAWLRVHRRRFYMKRKKRQGGLKECKSWNASPFTDKGYVTGSRKYHSVQPPPLHREDLRPFFNIASVDIWERRHDPRLYAKECM